MFKKTSIITVVICFMMMLPSHANAGWLTTLIDAGISGLSKVASLLLEKEKKLGIVPSSPSSTAKNAPPPKPTQEEIEDALDKLGSTCQIISSKGIPCAISYGLPGCTRSSATTTANTKSIQALAESMSSYVTGELKDSIINIVEGGEIEMDKEIFSGSLKSTVNAQVNNSSVFIWHMLKKKSNSCKSGEEFQVVTVRIINAAPGLFEEALVETSLGEEIGKGLIDASLKFIANKASETYKKKK